jgi:hypothetical protein
VRGRKGSFKQLFERFAPRASSFGSAFGVRAPTIPPTALLLSKSRIPWYQRLKGKHFPRRFPYFSQLLFFFSSLLLFFSRPMPSDPSNAESALPDDSDASSTYGFKRALAKVREFPRAPGIYLMKDSGGAGHLHRQGEESSRAGRELLSQGRGGGSADDRSGTRNLRHRFHRRGERGRRAAARSAIGQGRSAEVQQRPARRQVVPLLADHHRRGFSARGVHARTGAEGRESCTARF